MGWCGLSLWIRTAKFERSPTCRNPRKKGNGGGAGQASPVLLEAPHSGQLVLSSPSVKDGEELSLPYRGEGEGASLPLAWTGVPAGTVGLAIIMDHLAKGLEMKCYWTIWDIPADVTALSKNDRQIGRRGATSKRGETYVPPHSAGGGTKTYTIHLYALSRAPLFKQSADEVTREALIQEIRGSVIDSAEFRVLYMPTSTDGAPRSRGGCE